MFCILLSHSLCFLFHLQLLHTLSRLMIVHVMSMWLMVKMLSSTVILMQVQKLQFRGFWMESHLNVRAWFLEMFAFCIKLQAIHWIQMCRTYTCIYVAMTSYFLNEPVLFVVNFMYLCFYSCLWLLSFFCCACLFF